MTRHRGLILLAGLFLTAAAKPSSVDQFAIELGARLPGLCGIRVYGGTPRLADTLAELLLGQPAGGRIVESAEAARRAGLPCMLEVELTVQGAELVAVGRLLETEHDLWAEAIGKGSIRLAATFVQRSALDDELRAYLGPLSAAPAASLPTSRPTKARRLAFRPVRGGLDLEPALLALAASDLDHDGMAELLALTVDELVVIRLTGETPEIVARAPLDGAAPVPRPRSAVGTLVVADNTITAASSDHDTNTVYRWQAGQLVRLDAPAQPRRTFPFCAGTSGQLLPGQHLYAGLTTPTERIVSAQCAGTWLATVDPSGLLRIYADAGKTALATLTGVGAAFALADLDGDGELEVVTSAYRPPGSGDRFTISRIGANGAVQLVQRSNLVPGGITGLATGDFDGDGAIDIIGATRTVGAPRSELWIAD